MKALKRILKIISIILVFVLFNQIAFFAVSPPSFSHWSNHDIKVHRNNIDTAFFGTSHIYAAVDPRIFDAETGCFTMNCGSGGQGIKETYYYIDQMNKSCENLKNVFIDLYFEDFQLRKNNRGSEMQDKMVIYSRLTNPLSKIRYIGNVFEINELQYLVFPALYYNSHFEEFPNIIKQKLSPEYRNYASNFEYFKDKYIERGYIPYTQYDKNDSDRFHFADHIQYTREINYEAFEYLSKIISYCKDNSINLYFVQMPLSETANRENSEFLKYFDDKINEAIFKNGEINYLNLNATISRTEITDKTDFADGEHLSLSGSEKITKILAEHFLNISK